MPSAYSWAMIGAEVAAALNADDGRTVNRAKVAAGPGGNRGAMKTAESSAGPGTRGYPWKPPKPLSGRAPLPPKRP